MSLATVALLFLYASAASVEAASYVWGHVNKYAAPIYEEVVFIRGVNASVWVAYPPTESYLGEDYIITAMYAFDMQSDVDATCDAQVLRGGIGHNHTMVLFHNRLTAAAAASSYQNDDNDGNDGVQFKFVVYGLEL